MVRTLRILFSLFWVTGLAVVLSGCLAVTTVRVAGDVAEGAVRATGDVAEGAAKATGAVAGAVIPDGDKEDKE